MSMNLHVQAKRKVIVCKTGEEDFQYRGFNLWQTPTEVTYDILSKEDKANSYLEWVKSVCNNLYLYKAESSSLNKWLEEMEQGSWDIEWIAM